MYDPEDIASAAGCLAQLAVNEGRSGPFDLPTRVSELMSNWLASGLRFSTWDYYRVLDKFGATQIDSR